MAKESEVNPEAEAQRLADASAYRDAKQKLAIAGCPDHVAFHCPPHVAVVLARLDWPRLQKVAMLTTQLGEKSWELLGAVLDEKAV